MAESARGRRVLWLLVGLTILMAAAVAYIVAEPPCIEVRGIVDRRGIPALECTAYENLLPIGIVAWIVLAAILVVLVVLLRRGRSQVNRERD